ncbi:hypothetical protein [Candidatus Amarolinea dominans]|uniref:hypothetical protein n=1 Tax=Candidatus Amarolinea dominans TaxID=3140696 RepID=UPI0031373AFF|nr:hypothetical protein [Anaerolineae bacterium]
MSQHSKSRPGRYRIFVLSLWEAASSVPGGPAHQPGRPANGRTGFTSLDQLSAHLTAWMKGGEPTEQHIERELSDNIEQ